MLLQLLIATWEVFVASAPWLLFGFLVAGLLHVFLPQEKVTKHLGQPGLRSVFIASAVGVPLPLCSCSVIPVAISLRRAGASRGATASFLVSTPEIGVDSFLLSYGLLGAPIAFLRMAAAFVSAFLVGAVIDRTPETPASPTVDPAPCCKGQTNSQNTSASCHPGHSLHKRPRNQLLAALHYGFVELVDDLANLLILGFLIAGAISVLVPDSFFLTSGFSHFVTTLLMLLVSLPLYICASSATPIAAALMLKGLNPGAALVFLLAGPASNVTTMLAVKRELGAKALAIYLIGIFGVALSFGALLDLFMPTFVDVEALPALQPHLHSTFWSDLLAFVLLAVLTNSSLRHYWSKQKPSGSAS